MMRILRLLFVLVMCLGLRESRAVNRMYVAAKVNGKPAVFLFDTGADRSFLWSNGARRLGLTNLVGGYAIFGGSTEPCTLSIGKSTCQLWFGVAELPSYLTQMGDGILGWSTVQNNILRIDAQAGLVTPLEKVPKEARTWTRIPLVPNSPILSLQIPNEPSEAATLDVDTGNPRGVILLARHWQSWRKTSPNAPLTLYSDFNPLHGHVVWEESWASDITIGPLCLTEVPTCHACPVDVFSGPTNYAATLGMAALQRLDMIVDGPKGVAYVRPKQPPAPPYSHNRIGAVFLPGGPQTNQFVFRVLTNSPAYEAGVRDGDVLLKVNDYDVPKWPIDSSQDDRLDLEKFLPGHKVSLTLRRGPDTLVATITARHILGPPATSSAELGRMTNDFAGLRIRLKSNAVREYAARGAQYLDARDFERAFADFNEAMRLDPKLAPILWSAYHIPADLYYAQGQITTALSEYRKAIRLNPKDDWSYNEIAWIKATCPDPSIRNGKEAVSAATKACKLTGWKKWEWIDTLAAAYAEAGDFKRAIKVQEQALSTGNPPEAEQQVMRERLALYKQSRPFRDNR